MTNKIHDAAEFIVGEIWESSKGTIYRVTDEASDPVMVCGYPRRAVVLRQGLGGSKLGAKKIKAWNDVNGWCLSAVSVTEYQQKHFADHKPDNQSASALDHLNDWLNNKVSK